jgi:hypothetical protein
MKRLESIVDHGSTIAELHQLRPDMVSEPVGACKQLQFLMEKLTLESQSPHLGRALLSLGEELFERTKVNCRFVFPHRLAIGAIGLADSGGKLAVCAQDVRGEMFEVAGLDQFVTLARYNTSFEQVYADMVGRIRKALG